MLLDHPANMTAIVHRSNVLQHQIMVAETVKYPVNYPALIPLSPSVTGLGGVGGGYSSCSSSMIHANFSPAHLMDQKPPQQQQQQQPQPSPQGPSLGSPQHPDNTPVGLGAPGLHLPSPLELAAQFRKKEMFTQRKQREFIPDSKKDESYWDRRRRNNEAAKRSREKRRFNDMILEQRVVELSKENHIMKAQLNAIKDKYGIMGDNLINVDQVISNMPQTEQLIALNKRAKFSPSPMMGMSSGSNGNLMSPEGGMSSSSTSPYHNDTNGDSPPSPQNYSHYGGHDDHDSHFDNGDQYPPSSNGDLYFRTSALNLSTHPSDASPLSPTTSHMEYSPASEPELLRRSPISEAGSSLPHKLRHKSHLGDKDAAQSLLALQGIKAEPHDHHQEAAEDSVGSSDERDSGISYSSSSPCSDGYRRSSDTSSSPTNCMMSDNGMSSGRSQHHMQHYTLPQEQQYPKQQQSQQHPEGDEVVAEYENTHLRSELERLASEVATLKYMLVRRPRSEGDSDGSR